MGSSLSVRGIWWLTVVVSNETLVLSGLMCSSVSVKCGALSFSADYSVSS